jgi:predicted acyltransferase (DUF342 family)
MAIAHVTTSDSGSSARTKINQAIDEANKVSGKASQADLSAESSARAAAIAAEASARETADNALQSAINGKASNSALSSEAAARAESDELLQAAITAEATARANAITAEQTARDAAITAEATARSAGDAVRITYAEAVMGSVRPGEAIKLFTSNIDGAPSDVAPLTDANRAVGAHGAVGVINGSGYVAPIAVWRLEPGRQYRVRFVVQRAVDTADPSNDAVRLGLRWLKKDKSGLSSTNLADLLDVTVADGRLEYTYNFALTAADNIDVKAALTSVYVRPFVRTFGSGVTHIELIEVTDLTETIEWSPDVSEYRNEVAGITQRVDMIEDRLEMMPSLPIGDGNATNGGAAALIRGEGDYFSIIPTDLLGSFNTLKEFSFDAGGDAIWTAEGGFRTTGSLIVYESGSFGENLTVEGNGTFGGNVVIGGTIDVTGEAAFQDDVRVAGHVDITLTLDVQGNAILQSDVAIGQDLTVGGTSTFTGAGSFLSTLSVTGAVTFASTLDVTGAVTFGDNLSVAGDTDLTGTLTVGGDTSLISNLTVGGTFDLTGAATLGSTLSVVGDTTLQANLAVTGNTTVGGTVDIDGATTIDDTLGVTGAVTFGSTLGVTGAATFADTLSVTGNVTFSANFDVAGDTTLGGTLGVTGAVGLLSTLDVDGDATFDSNVLIGGTLGVTGAVTFSSTLNVTGDLTLAANLDVSGDTTLDGLLGVTGAAGFLSTIDVAGDATFDANVAVGGTLGVTLGATFSSTVDVTGNTTVGGTFTTTGAATFQSTLGVTGDVTLSADLSVAVDATVGGALGVTGLATLASLTVTGTSIIGDGAGDSVTIKGTLVNSYSSGLLSNADAAAWRTSLDVYDKAYVDGLIAAQDAMVFKGVIDCSSNPNYPAADRGWTYRVSVAGKIGGASGPDVEAGDILICTVDSTVTGDHATVGANWAIIQVNIDGALTTDDVGATVQAHDADLDAIAALAATDDDFLQRKAGAWSNRTPTQVLADLQAVPGFDIWVSPPASASATGVAGQKAYDADYLYLCVATDTWRRIAHATW